MQEKVPEKKASPPNAQPREGMKPQPPLSAENLLSPEGEFEEPEEVLVVEPLEAADSLNLEQALASENLGFESEAAPESVTQEPEESGAPSLEVLESIGELSSAVETEGTEAAAFPVESIPEPEGEGKAGDDFTTDTLAELYISQGFYEKAIDIYERMLADNPNSQGLKDKLSSVRAMAEQAAPAAAEEAGGPSGVPEGFAEDLGPFEMPGAEIAPEIAPLPREAEPALSGQEWVGATEGAEQTFSEEQPQQPLSVEAGFEPKEYAPPAAVPPQEAGTAAEEGSAGKIEKESPAIRKAAPGRKETIARLENWLNQIKKEK